MVFRARGRPPTGGGGGGGGEPFRGIYTRDMSSAGQPILIPADNKTTVVPQPNNLGTTFTEFPSFPRIDVNGVIAFRGQHEPVWEYIIDPVAGTETRMGTSGVYSDPTGARATGASQLGAVPGFEQFSVPGSAPAGTKFDQFPGAPSPDGDIVTFKGNWTDADDEGMPGVYFRDLVAGGGTSAIQLIAERGMAIPNEGGNPGSGAVFGSTAPPSASAGKVAFAGFDNEDAPTAGGIYLADIAPSPVVNAVVDFSTEVPGAAGQTFNRFGEAISFNDGRIGFWGAWGSETRTVTLTCPTDGNADLIAACLDQYPTGTTTREAPVNQGIFVADLASGKVEKVAATGEDGILDMLFWNFPGRPPGTGEGGDEGDDAEPPRWRNTAFIAVNGDNTVFKATDATYDRLYVDFGPSSPFEGLLGTDMVGTVLDADVPAGAMIVALGLERDGHRGGRLAINASFLNETTGESWAGIHLSRLTAPVPVPAALPLLAAAVAGLGLPRRRRRT